MSDEIDVYWRGHLAADGPTLRAALAVLGFDAKILSEFSQARGFWPIEFEGGATGFEVYPHELGGDPEEIAALDGRDKAATFRFFGNMEGGVAFAVAAALAKLGDGVIRDRHTGVDIWLGSEEDAEKACGMMKRANIDHGCG